MAWAELGTGALSWALEASSTLSAATGPPLFYFDPPCLNPLKSQPQIKVPRKPPPILAGFSCKGMRKKQAGRLKSEGEVAFPEQHNRRRVRTLRRGLSLREERERRMVQGKGSGAKRKKRGGKCHSPPNPIRL